MSSVFSTLHESLQQVLSQRLDWTELREVQERTYPAVASGSDVLVIAPTAGGKSEAALIPVMDDILKNGRMGVACLYISPLKALINDQEDRFSEFCIPTSLSVMKWHGDVAKGDRSWKDGEPPHFLMITPESLEVLLQEKTLSSDLRRVRTIIIDELHVFVESERGVHLKVLLDRMDRITKKTVQRIGLSATTGNPKEVLAWLSEGRHNAEIVEVLSPPKEKQFLFIVEPEETERINALVRIVDGKKALVFVNSRSVAEKLMRASTGRIRNLHIHHSSLSLATRKTSEDAFSSQEGACIICTSTLELGIDIGDLDVVVQIGVPNSVSSFLQRMGRSGRRGKSAYVAWVLQNPCELLCSLSIIECATKKEVENLTPPNKPYNVLLQQIFLYMVNHSRASRKQLISSALSPPVFGNISPKILDQIVTHLVQEGYLTTDGEMIMLGTEAERVFGRSNWKDLYSVISGGGEYRAVTPDGEVVGKLDARFVNSKNSDEISLGGQSWSMVKCDEGHNIVIVVPSGSNHSRIFWTSASEGGFSPLVCRMVQKIRANGGTVLPLGEREVGILKTMLGRIPEGVGQPGIHVVEQTRAKGVEVKIFTFAGGRFNRVLTLLLQDRLGRKAQVRYNDFIVKVMHVGKDGAGQRVWIALQDIRNLEKDEIGAALPVPQTDGWKFARVLPPALLNDLSLSDHYHIEDFMETVRNEPIKITEQIEPGQESYEI
ncbi:MAG: DEAD/DEAH box helicase [Methanoregula sp.]|nr:DEAD/DEAH box helicase [Methanoregula sp.]